MTNKASRFPGVMSLPDPFELMRLQTEASLMAAEAGAVIWMRTLGMMGLWHVSPAENVRMVAEKQAALVQSGHAVMKSAWNGDGAGEAMAASLRPFRQKTKSNARRLTRRGPKT